MFGACFGIAISGSTMFPVAGRIEAYTREALELGPAAAVCLLLALLAGWLQRRRAPNAGKPGS